MPGTATITTSIAGRILALLGLLVAAASPSGAGAAEDQSLLYLQSLDQRIADISWRLIASNVELCPRRINAIGVVLHDAAQYAPAYRQAAIDTFRFGDGLPAILAVARGSPADRTGLRQGDRLATVDGKEVPPVRLAPKARETYVAVAAAMDQVEGLPDQPVKVEILRGDDRMVLEIHPRPACRSRVEVVPSGEINANSNGLVVQIYGKLALWTKTDDELATVIGHEMAHNILDHNGRIEREGIGKGPFASLGFGQGKRRDIEREADRYGLYLVARAGYDYREAPDFWRRLTNNTGLGGIWATTHPSAGDRAAFNKAVVAEIDGKKAAGNALVP